jgi:putative hydrolase of the HAD superfamily
MNTEQTNMARNIRNIAFDLGGVVIELNMEQAIKAFERIGMKDAHLQLDAYTQKGLFADLESGKIDTEAFREGLSRIVGRELSMEDCYEAVHAYVGRVQKIGLKRILELRKKGYQVCLLSNTNPLMMQWVDSNDFDGEGHPISYYFDKLYLSYKCKAMKPSPEIFKMMLDGQGAHPEETLFIDDSQKNVETAASLGILTLCPKNGQDWTLLPEIKCL